MEARYPTIDVIQSRNKERINNYPFILSNKSYVNFIFRNSWLNYIPHLFLSWQSCLWGIFYIQAVQLALLWVLDVYWLPEYYMVRNLGTKLKQANFLVCRNNKCALLTRFSLCLRMADRVLLAGYHRNVFIKYNLYQYSCINIVTIIVHYFIIFTCYLFTVTMMGSFHGNHKRAATFLRIRNIL